MVGSIMVVGTLLYSMSDFKVTQLNMLGSLRPSGLLNDIFLVVNFGQKNFFCTINVK